MIKTLEKRDGMLKLEIALVDGYIIDEDGVLHLEESVPIEHLQYVLAQSDRKVDIGPGPERPHDVWQSE